MYRTLYSATWAQALNWLGRTAPTAQNGWGGRIRTSVWRDQNPLPYRLATPQWNQQSANSLEPILSRSLIFQARASRSIRELKMHPAPAVTSAQFPVQAQSSRRPKKHRLRFPSGAPHHTATASRVHAPPLEIGAVPRPNSRFVHRTPGSREL